MPDIMHLVKIHASPDEVYQAITTAEGVQNWWTRDTALDSKVGGTGEFGFNDHQFVIKVVIDELTPQTHVGWKIISSGLPAFDGTTIAFDVRANAGDTMLAFAHRGFKRADDGFAGATTRWGFYLISLKRYLEGGQGSPNPVDADL
jgi:uncharacterized protein YndB with AHSA1/START domain